MAEEIGAHTEKKKRGCGFWILIALGVIVVLAVIGTLGAPTPEEEAEAEAAQAAEDEANAMEVSAMELWQAYDANEVAAQNQFGNTPLRVTGTVNSIALDFADDPFVTFETGNQFQNVQADLADEDPNQVSTLAKGQNITVLCSSISEIAGTPMLRDCRLR